MGLLAVIKNRKAKIRQDFKNRVMKNKEAMLDVFGKNIKGARSCPLLLGQKCIGEMCEFFMEFKTINVETKTEIPYWRCAFVQTPLLLIEINDSIRRVENIKK